jgi:hypothetical protein
LNFFRVYALTVFTNNTRADFLSHYSTLGTLPTRFRSFHISIVQSSTIENCDLNPSKSSAGSIKDYMLVLNGSLHMFSACSTDLHAKATTFAVLAQQLGALGVIVEQFDEVINIF